MKTTHIHTLTFTSTLSGKLIVRCFFCSVFLLLTIVADAQVRVPFKPRTSSAAQNRSIYNVRGDYTIIGNTNMTLVNYTNTGNNDNMKYVNVDNTNPYIFNSSSADLQFTNSDGADPACTKVVYAGLYWTGRAHDGTSANTFSVSKSLPAGTPIDNIQTVANGDNVSGTNYTMGISRQGPGYEMSVVRAGGQDVVYTMTLSYTGTSLRYTFTPASGSNLLPFYFEFRGSGNQPGNFSVYYSENATSWTQVTCSITPNGNSPKTASFTHSVNAGGGNTVIVSQLVRPNSSSINVNNDNITADLSVNGQDVQTAIGNNSNFTIANYYPRYVFSGTGYTTTWVEYRNDNTVRYSTNSGSNWTTIPATFDVTGNIATAVISPAFTLPGTGGISADLSQLVRDARRDLTEAQYQTGGGTYTASSASISVDGAATSSFTHGSAIYAAYYPRYTLTGATPVIWLEYLNDGTVRYSTNSGVSWTPVSTGAQTVGTNTHTIPVTPEFTIYTGSGLTVKLSQLTRHSATNGTLADYTNTTNNNIKLHITGTSTQSSTYATTLDKHVVKLRHASDNSYYQVVAAANNFQTNIYYPTNTDGYMYSAYADVTEYVKQYGVGNYFVADIALREGNGGGTGFYGGWGMVVVYENSQMKWRDISVFDGHAYVAGSTTANYDLPISGFHAVQQGEVNVKVGMMAGEGDVGITGDYFSMYNQTQGAFTRLSHGGNATDNFFNSSIYTGGNARNPNLLNNTGLDISMFQINNTAKQYITNDQTSTTFRYGSTQDTYVIFCIVLGIDAYIPEPEVENAAVSVRSKDEIPITPVNGAYTVEPGAKIDYELRVRNRGPEAIDNLVINFPVPYTTKLISHSETYNPPIPSGSFAYDQSVGASGTIVWSVGNIPKSSVTYSADYVYAVLKFTLEVTEDCNILASVGSCVPGVTIEGSVGGTGHDTKISFTDQNFIYGFQTDCAGTPITEAPKIDIDTKSHPCGGTYNVRTIIACTQETTIPYNVVAENFQTGARFYNTIDEITGKPPVDATEYTLESGFPITPDVTYYAVPASLSTSCYWSFKLQVGSPPSFTVSEGLTCQSDNINLADLVSGKMPANSDVKYYDNSTATNEINSIVAPAVQTTYYVRSYTTGYGCNSAITPVVINVTPRATETTITAGSVTICTDSTTNLTASSAVANPTYRWYAAQTDLTPIHEGPEFTTGALTTKVTRDTVFFVSVEGDGICENLPGARKAVSVTITQLPVIKITTENGNPDALCHNATIDLVTTHTGVVSWIGWYDKAGINPNRVQFSPDPIINPVTSSTNRVTYDPDPSEAGTTVKLYVRANTGGACPYVADTIRLKILPIPTRVDATIISQPDVLTMCEPSEFLVRIKSVEPGDLQNLTIEAHDYKLTEISISPFATAGRDTADWGSAQPMTGVLVGYGTTWNLGAMTEGDSIFVKMIATPECNKFFSGSDMAFHINAQNACNIPFRENVLNTEVLYLDSDDESANKYAISSEFRFADQGQTNYALPPDYVLRNNISDTIVWRLKAVVPADGNPTDGNTEELFCFVPRGLSVVPNSYRPIQNVPNREDAELDVNFNPVSNGTEIFMKMPDKVQPGETMELEFKIFAAGAPCGPYDLFSEVEYSHEAICGGNSCESFGTRGSNNISLTVERYRFSLNDTIEGSVVNNLWSAVAKIQAQTPFFAGDSILIDFYIDKDNDSKVSAGDPMVYHHKYITKNLNREDIFTDTYNDVPIEAGKKLLARVNGASICEDMIIPLGVITGPDRVCQYDTTMYETSPGMILYKWKVDGVSGASPVRIPVEGETQVTAVPHVARIVWPKEGNNYRVWTQYSIPNMIVDGEPVEIGKTYFPVKVNPIPVLALTAPDTTICENGRMELTHFFRDVTQLSGTTIDIYRKEPDGRYTFLTNTKPFHVEPWNTTDYMAIADCSPTGCTSVPVEFRVNVNKIPQIVSVNVVAQPTCGNNNGSIKLSVAGGSGNYQAGLNDEVSFADLSSDGIIGNLPAGNYTAYLKDKTGPGCAISIGAPISLNPGSGLFVTATTTDAGACDGTGTIAVIALGGSAPYQYRVNGGAYMPLPTTVDAVIGSFPAGHYRIDVKDADNCVATADAVNIKVTGGLDLTLSQIEPADCTTQGSAKITVAGGVAPFRYRTDGKGWLAMATDNATLPLDAGIHEIFVKDANGCETSKAVTVNNTATLTASIDAVIDATCNGAKPGSIRLTVSGGTGQLKYSIDGGKTNTDISAGTVTIPNVAVGNYQILLTAAGCTFALDGIEMNTEHDFVNASGNHIITYKNVPVSGYVIYNDFDYRNERLTISNRIHDALHGTITEFNPTTFRVGYTPDIDFTGMDSVLYAVKNTCGMEREVWLTFEVLDTVTVNRPPLALSNEYTIRKGGSLVDFEVRVNDRSFGNGTLKNPVKVTNPLNGTLTQKSDGTFTYVPYPNFAGVDKFVYRVCDENNLCDEAQVNITVDENKIYDNEVLASADAYQTDKYGMLEITTIAAGVLGNDAYTGAPTVTVLTDVQHGTLLLNPGNGTFTYTPNTGYAGRDVFLYKVCVASKCDSMYASIFTVERPCPSPVTLSVADTLTTCESDSINLNTAVLPSSINIAAIEFYADKKYSIPMPRPYAKTEGMYYIQASNVYGCSKYDSVYIRINLPLSGIRTVGNLPGADFATLKAAADRYNRCGISADCRLTIVGNLTETETAEFLGTAPGSLSYTLTIVSDGTRRTIGGNINGPLVKFTGANNIIIDGTNAATEANPTASLLSFVNTYATSSTNVRAISMVKEGTSNGKHIRIRNSEWSVTQKLAGAVVSNHIDSIFIENSYIHGGYIGIDAPGNTLRHVSIKSNVVSGLNLHGIYLLPDLTANITVTGNVVMDIVPTKAGSKATGVTVQHTATSSGVWDISGNRIANISNMTSNSCTTDGILIQSNNANIRCNNNVVEGLTNNNASATAGYGLVGINILQSGVATTGTLQMAGDTVRNLTSESYTIAFAASRSGSSGNATLRKLYVSGINGKSERPNFYDVLGIFLVGKADVDASTITGLRNPNGSATGIFIPNSLGNSVVLSNNMISDIVAPKAMGISVTGTASIYHNTVRLTVKTNDTDEATAVNIGDRYQNVQAVVTLQNNLLSNEIPGGSARNFIIKRQPGATISNMASANNRYRIVNGNAAAVVTNAATQAATVYATLKSWAAFSNDNSLPASPVFAGAVDLHLASFTPGLHVPLITSVNKDFDGDTRTACSNAAGADNFTAAPVFTLGQPTVTYANCTATVAFETTGGVPAFQYSLNGTTYNPAMVDSFTMQGTRAVYFNVPVPAGGGNYTFNLRDVNGCIFTIPGNYTLTAYPAPVIGAVESACVGDRVIFDTGTSYSQYQWSITAGTGGAMEGAGTAYREYFTWSTASTKTVTVTTTDANGCKKTATRNIVIYPRPETGPVYRAPNQN